MMKKNYLSCVILFVGLLLPFGGNAQASLSATYSAGDIPTGYSSFDASCNGSSTAISITLPTGGPWLVVGLDVAYDMTANAGNIAWKSEQRSQIFFQNAGVAESTVYSGNGNSSGIQSYSRTDVGIADGTYPGGTVLIFEMRAWRTYGSSPACGTDYQKVDNNTWTITVNYENGACPSPSNLAVGNVISTGADVSWTENGTATAWNLEYGPDGFAPGTGTLVPVTAMTYSITGLTAFTDYDVYVQADCGTVNGLSAWVGPESFYTCDATSLGITGTTPGSVCGGGSVTLTATATGNGNDIFWYDAAIGGNKVGEGSPFMTPDISATTSFWAAEVSTAGSGGSGQLPELLYYQFDNGAAINNTALTPVGNNPASITGSGLSVGGTGLSGTALVGTAASSSSNIINTGWNTNLTGSFTIGFWTEVTPSTTLNYIWGDTGANGFRCFTGGVAGINNWIVRGGNLPDLDVTGGASASPNYIHIVYDAPAGTYTSYVDGVLNTTLSVSTSNTISGSGFTVGGYGSTTGLNGSMDEFRIYNRALPLSEIQTTIASTVGGGVALCESARIEVVATVNNVADIEIASINPTAYTHTDNTINYGNNYSGAPGSGCGTTGDYLDGYDVVYHYQATDDYIMNVALSGLSFGGSSVFVYESCADIGSACIAGEINPFSTNYDYDVNIVNGQDYYIVVSSSDETVSSIGYTLTVSATPIVCTDYFITATTGDTVTCQGSGLLTATGSGTPSAVIRWYDDAVAGNLVHTGPIYNTPSVSATTSYWATEAIIESGASGTVICESARVQATVTITTSGDINIPAVVPPALLNYTDLNNNTANYGDPYELDPGTGCNTAENYLNGNDVVYYFTAPATDLVDIRLSDLTDFYAGLFVYEDCPAFSTNCVAGAVAGPSDNDFGIDDFPMVAGEDYYVVVSSWLTPSLGYTLEILQFDCAALPAPTGEAIQSYPAPTTPPKTIAYLQATPTEAGGTIIWTDSPSAGGTPYASGDPLVNGTTYYAHQVYNGCESPAALAVTVSEIDCSVLGITATTGDQISCQGSMTLTATATLNGNDVYWYDAAVGGNVVATGPVFETPVLTSTKSYWVTEVFEESGSSGGGSIPTGYCVPTISPGCTSGDDVDDFTLSDSGGTKIIEHLASGCSPNAYGDFTGNAGLTGNLLPGSTYDFTITSNYPSEDMKIWIDFNQNASFADPGELLYTSSTSTSLFVDVISIPASVQPGATVMRIRAADFSPPVDACSPDSFGEVHDYKVTIGGGSAVLCESPRVQVDATVVSTGEKFVTFSDLPYTDTDNTANWPDKFSGDPGANCDGKNFLDSREVIYEYTADPANDDILDIELSGINNPNTGMYIYSGCADVGINCLAGGSSGGGGSILVDDYYVTAGTSFFIVVSSQFSTVGYTLTINGIDCNSLAGPTGNASPLFVQGEDLLDLTISGNVYNTGFTWYAELSDIPANPIVDPSLEIMVDGEDYYVTQTVLGCESQPFQITVTEFQCQNLKITSAPGAQLCQPGGPVSLTAAGGGFGTELNWYDAPSGGTLLHTGPTFNTSVVQTTSFWVVESYADALNGFLCSSGPVQVTVTVNTQSVNAPTGSNAQEFCEGSTLADVVVNGSNIVWYDAQSGGSSLPNSELLVDGATYYAAQAINACESPGRLPVTATVVPVAPVPTGTANQTYIPGQTDTLADLAVTGTNLTWYSDPGMDPQDIISEDTVVQDQDTYYVTQHPVGFCESPALAITVHIDQTASVDDPVFDGLAYYPNPVRHKLTVSHTLPIESIGLYNLLGERIFQKEIGASNTTINTANLQTGVYLLKITVEGKTGTFKLVKE